MAGPKKMRADRRWRAHDFARQDHVSAAAALLEKKIDAKGRRVGVVLSGGNVDFAWAATKLAPH